MYAHKLQASAETKYINHTMLFLVNRIHIWTPCHSSIVKAKLQIVLWNFKLMHTHITGKWYRAEDI
jgi:hypothetical protein